MRNRVLQSGFVKICLTLTGVIFSATSFADSKESAVLKDGEIWNKQIGSTTLTQLTKDGKPKNLIGTSPNGRLIAYYASVAGQDNSSPTVLVILSGDGKKLIEFTPSDSDGNACVSILSTEWIDNQRIGTVCHINPSLSSYMVIDATTGKTSHCYLGYSFFWSPDRQTLAHVGQMTHFAPWPHSEYIQFNETTVYPPCGAVYGKNDRTVHTFMPSFVWSPDGQSLAVIDILSGKGSGAQLVLLGRDGRKVFKKLPVPGEAAGRDAIVKWESARRVNVRGKNFSLFAEI